MDRRTKDPTFAILRTLPLLVLVGLGCSASPGDVSVLGAPTSESTRPSLDPLRPGASIVCDSPDTVGGAPAVYMLSAMNHKLQHYPEFAATIGIDLVRDCESGQRFMDGYVAYRADHPHFDADEPLAPSPVDDGPLPAIEPVEPGETQKIGGTSVGVTNNPVVEITFTTCSHRNCPNAGDDWITPSGDLRHETFQCSATFISKNWLLTSAHCLTAAAVDTCMEAGVERSQCTPDWPQWGQWSIRGTKTISVGNDTFVGTADDVHGPSTLTRVWARGYVHDNWPGTIPSKNRLLCDNPAFCFEPEPSADHDVALLYVRSEYDNQLPPRVEWDGAKRLAIAQPRDKSLPKVDPAPNWQVAIYGWGPPGPIGTRPMKARSGSFENGPFGTPSVDLLRIDFDVTATAANRNPAYICGGDSGGPLVRTIPMLQTVVGPQSNVEAVVGVLSSVESSVFGQSAPCSATELPLGTRVIWHATRVDAGINREFIEKTIKRWTNTRFFDCHEKPLPGGSRVEIEECWGPPCSNAGMPPEGCALATDQCWSPPRTVAATHASCSACDGFTGTLAGCGCVLGQCLPTK